MENFISIANQYAEIAIPYVVYMSTALVALFVGHWILCTTLAFSLKQSKRFWKFLGRPSRFVLEKSLASAMSAHESICIKLGEEQIINSQLRAEISDLKIKLDSTRLITQQSLKQIAKQESEQVYKRYIEGKPFDGSLEFDQIFQQTPPIAYNLDFVRHNSHWFNEDFEQKPEPQYVDYIPKDAVDITYQRETDDRGDGRLTINWREPSPLDDFVEEIPVPTPYSGGSKPKPDPDAGILQVMRSLITDKPPKPNPTQLVIITERENRSPTIDRTSVELSSAESIHKAVSVNPHAIVEHWSAELLCIRFKTAN